MNHRSRRTFQVGLATGALATLLPRTATAAAQANRANVIETNLIDADSAFYYGWPTLTRRRNGELLLVVSGGRESHVCPFGRVELLRSSDEGATWSYPRTLLDGDLDDRDAGILETAAGTLLVTTFTSLAYEPLLAAAEAAAQRTTSPEGSKPSGVVPAVAWPAERLQRWQAVQRRTTAQQRKEQVGVWMLRSTDGGRSWSPPYDSLVNSPHGPIQLADGRLLHAGKDLWRSGGKVGVCESRDDGRTWHWLAEITPRAGDDIAEYHELHAVEAEPGHLVLHIRNHNPRNAGETLQCESTDGGKTWSKPHDIGVWGLPSHLLRLRDGRLLMSYGHRRAPLGIQARLSTDGGRTWSESMTVSGDGVTGDLGYPSTVELKDGSFLTVWYEVRPGSPRAVLRQARWKLT
jgi:sialidase-1